MSYPTITPTISYFPSQPPPPSSFSPFSPPTDLIAEIRIRLVLDEYPDETSSELNCDSDVVHLGDYDVGFVPRPPFSEVNEYFNVRRGAFCQFVIYDSFGDGLHDSADDDSYQIFIDDKLVLKGSPEFEWKFLVTFLASSDATPPTPTPTFSPFFFLDDDTEDTPDPDPIPGIIVAMVFGVFILVALVYLNKKNQERERRQTLNQRRANLDALAFMNAQQQQQQQQDSTAAPTAEERRRFIEQVLITRQVLPRRNDTTTRSSSSQRTLEFSERSFHPYSERTIGFSERDNTNENIVSNLPQQMNEDGQEDNDDGDHQAEQPSSLRTFTSGTTSAAATTTTTTTTTTRTRKRPKRNFVIRAVATTLRSIGSDPDNPTTCDICLMDYQEGEQVCWSPNENCVHAFHKECIVDWLMSKPTCPSCRRYYLAADGSPSSSPMQAASS